MGFGVRELKCTVSRPNQLCGRKAGKGGSCEEKSAELP